VSLRNLVVVAVSLRNLKGFASGEIGGTLARLL